MITGRWGKPTEVLLDLTVDPDGTVHGVANPGTLNAPIQRGHFDAKTGAVQREGEHTKPDGSVQGFRIEGRLEGRTLELGYQFGDLQGSIELVRVEEYKPPQPTLLDRLKPF